MHLVTVHRDVAQPIAARLAAATCAVRDEKPALASIDVSSTNEHVVHTIGAEPTPEEWEAKHATH
jgi:hypothetical protein